jgi:hypothetical protein
MLSRRSAALATSIILVACSGGGAASPVVSPDPLQDPSADSPQNGWTTLASRPCPENSDLTYENFGEPFLLTWCTGCHSSNLQAGARENAPLNVNFDTVDEVRQLAPKIWLMAGDFNTTMPPAGGPQPDDRTLLGEWLACGAP